MNSKETAERVKELKSQGFTTSEAVAEIQNEELIAIDKENIIAESKTPWEDEEER